MKTKNKKGNVHIDWVISISIFLTYIIILLAFIKPSYKPSFEGDVLVNLVKKNFDEKIEWQVKKNLLSFRCETKGVANVDLKNYIPDIGKYKVLLKDGKTKARYKGSLIDLMNDDYDFWIIHNEFFGYNLDDNGLEDDGGADPKDCEISAANPIIFRGINADKLNLVDLKIDEWNFPQFRQFKITVLDVDGSLKDNRYCFAKGLMNSNECLLAEPPLDVVVYGVNLGDAILDKDGNFEQVILNIQVW